MRAIFGSTPTDTKIHALIDNRADYFASYGGDGVNGQGTKAAMAGWLLAETVKVDIGIYARSNDAFLTDLADGAAHQRSRGRRAAKSLRKVVAATPASPMAWLI